MKEFEQNNYQSFFPDRDKVNEVFPFEGTGVVEEDLECAVLYYAMNTRFASLTMILKLSDDEKAKIGEEFLQECKEKPFIGPLSKEAGKKNVQRNLAWLGVNYDRGSAFMRNELIVPAEEDLATPEAAKNWLEHKAPVFIRMMNHAQNRLPKLWGSKDTQETEKNPYGLAMQDYFEQGVSGGQYGYERNQNMWKAFDSIVKSAKIIAGETNLPLARRGFEKLLVMGEHVPKAKLLDQDNVEIHNEIHEKLDHMDLGKYFKLTDEEWKVIIDNPLSVIKRKHMDLYEKVLESMTRMDARGYRRLAKEWKEEKKKLLEEQAKERQKEMYKNGLDADQFMPQGWRENPKITGALATLGITDINNKEAMEAFVVNFILADKRIPIDRMASATQEEKEDVKKKIAEALENKKPEELIEWHGENTRWAMWVLKADYDKAFPDMAEDLYTNGKAEKLADTQLAFFGRVCKNLARDAEKRLENREQSKGYFAEDGKDGGAFQTMFIFGTIGSYLEKRKTEPAGENPSKEEKDRHSKQQVYHAEVIRSVLMPKIRKITIKKAYENLDKEDWDLGRTTFQMMEKGPSEEYLSKGNFENFLTGKTPSYLKAIDSRSPFPAKSVKTELADSEQRQREAIEKERIDRVKGQISTLNENGYPPLKDSEVFRYGAHRTITFMNYEDLRIYDEHFDKVFGGIEELENPYAEMHGKYSFLQNFYVDGKNVWDEMKKDIQNDYDKKRSDEFVAKTVKAMIMRELCFNENGLTYVPFAGSKDGKIEPIVINQEKTVKPEIERQKEEVRRREEEEKERKRLAEEEQPPKKQNQQPKKEEQKVVKQEKNDAPKNGAEADQQAPWRPVPGQGELIGRYRAAMFDFQTKRASFFTQESEQHKALRLAAQDLIKDREGKFETAGQMEQHIKNIENEDEQKKAILDWLKKTGKILAEADVYIKDKTGMTFAGSDRMRGAKAIRTLARGEMQSIETLVNELEIENFSIKDAKLEIARDYSSAAGTLLSKQDPKLTGLAMDANLQKTVKNIIYDSVAALATKRMLESDQPIAANAPSDYFSMRKALERDKDFGTAVDNYMKQTNPAPTVESILNQMSDNFGAGLMEKLSRLNNPKVLRPHVQANHRLQM